MVGRFRLATILVAACLMAGSAMAQSGRVDDCAGDKTMMGHGDGHAGAMHGLPMGLERLALSAEQRERIAAIVRERKPLMQDQIAVLREGRRALRRAAIQEPVDKAAIERLTRRQGEAVADMIRLRTETFARIWAVLTPEQRETLQRRRPLAEPGEGVE